MICVHCEREIDEPLDGICPFCDNLAKIPLGPPGTEPTALKPASKKAKKKPAAKK